MTIKCFKCSEIAVWKYAPASEMEESERYFCDDHIDRGCSCNVIILDENHPDYSKGEEYRDEQGRLLPCCENDYHAAGWDKDGWMNMYEDWSPYNEEFDF